MNRKEFFTEQLPVAGLAYTTVTTVYSDGLLTTMYARGHRDTGKEGVKMLGDPIHVVFQDPKSLEHNKELVVKELQKTLGLSVPTETSLPA